MSQQKKTFKEALTEVLGVIKVAMGSDMPGPVTPIAPVTEPAPTKMSTDYPLADGTTVTIDTLAVGGMITIAGNPAPDGEYVLPDGTNVTSAGGVITEVASKEAEQVEEEIPTDLTTAEDFKKAFAKFATGTPEQRIANLEVIAKATMEYCFGYEIRRAQQDATQAAAINVYKTGFAKIEAENKTLRVALQKTADLLQAIGDSPVAVALTEQKPTEELTPYQIHKLKKAEREGN